MNIIEIIPQDDHVLYIKAENSVEGLFDVKPYLESEAFTPLKSRDEFERVYNGKYFVEWDCRADLSADTIEARWEIISVNNAQINAPVNAKKRRG